MNLLCVAMLVAGQAGPDYFPMKTRNLKLVVNYDPAVRKDARQVLLYSSRDQGQVWTYEASIKPDKDYFAFVAKDDGPYWFQMVVEFADGKKDPPDVTRAPDPHKILVDTTLPVLRIAEARRAGDDIAVEWSLDEKYPNDAKTVVSYRAAGESAWKDVPVTAGDRRGTTFNPMTNAAVQVRVTAEDLCGNAATQTRDVPGTATVPSPLAPAAAAAPPDFNLSPPVLQPAGATGPPVVNLTAPPAAAPPGAFTAPAMPDFRPTPPPPSMPPAPPGPAPIASGAGTAPPPASAPVATAPTDPAPVPDLPAAHLVNFTRFDLPYQLEAGPSGVKRIDLYITRDDGKSWVNWSQHDGKESPLKVSLEAKFNPQPEGTYGFKLVPTSGSGLSEDPPKAGSPPEFRVQYDRTPPMIYVYRPESDVASRDVLVLKWLVTDKNLGKEPVQIEWSEAAAGPWKAVAGDAGGVVPVAAAAQTEAAAARIPNTGSHPWRVPATVPAAGIYLKMTAWDGAGNRSEVVTPNPIPVDTVKPKARIQGIAPSAAATRS